MVFRALLLAVFVGLGGCGAVPPAVSVASLAADAFSYAVSGKSVSDHGLSMAVKEDCAVLNFIQGQALCAPGPHPKIEMVTPRDTESERMLLASVSGKNHSHPPDREGLRWAPTGTEGLTVEYLVTGILDGPRAVLTLEPLTSGPVDIVAAGDAGEPSV
ncbi:MAG TPA: hypothetical protein VED46_04900 [Alphaproteobacteria bacterium]|jgi:hypothetical protein|nr:hypothetical protein [Alphaproteobacteria bacterium]